MVFPAPQAASQQRSGVTAGTPGKTITGSSNWTRYQITGQVPADADTMGFELTLTGPGTVRLRHLELTRAR
jgi:hypothetical protein